MLDKVDSIPGWLTKAETIELNRLAAGKTVLEAGSYCGKSSVTLGLSAKSLLCIDPFDGRGTPDTRDTLLEFQQTIKKFNLWDKVSYIKATVEEWSEATSTKKFDLVFIDTEHTKPILLSNINSLHRFISNKGIVAFHDYNNPQFPAFTSAINNLFHRPPDRLIDSLAIYLMDGSIPGRTLHIVTSSIRVNNLLTILLIIN